MGITTNYLWTVPAEGDKPWTIPYDILWQNVDTELYKRTKDLYMQGFALYGSDQPGGDLHLYSNPSHDGKIYLGANDYFDENIGNWHRIVITDYFVLTGSPSTAISYWVPNADGAAMMSLGSDLPASGANLAITNTAGHDFIWIKSGGGGANYFDNGTWRFRFTDAGLLIFGDHLSTVPALKPLTLDSFTGIASYLGDNSGLGNLIGKEVYLKNVTDENTLRIVYTAFAGAEQHYPLIVTNDSGLVTFSLGGYEGFYEGQLTLRAPTGQASGSLITMQSDIGGTSKAASFSLDGGGNLVFRSNQVGLYFDCMATGSIHFRTTDAQTERLTILTGGNVGIGDTNPGELLDVAGNINATGVLKVDDVQVVSNRVIDARASAVANSGDGTTDGLIDALRDAMIAHGLIAAA